MNTMTDEEELNQMVMVGCLLLPALLLWFVLDKMGDALEWASFGILKKPEW